MLSKKKLSFIIIALCCGLFSTMAQRSVINPETDKKLLKKWQGLKLGMFVSWMPCHSPGTGDSWSIGNGTPKSVSDSITMRWNPDKFDPVAMVDGAVKAGCKYMVVISKHHDGFAIWDSEYSSFDLEKIKFKRDILKELGDECRKRGLLYGIYFSIADIDYMGWPRMFAAEELSPEPLKGRADFMAYTKNQVKELITRYNPDILWWDGFWQPPVWTETEGKELYRYMKSIKSNILCTRVALTANSSSKELFLSDGADGDIFGSEGKTMEAPPYPAEMITSITYPVYAYEPNAKIMSKQQLYKTFSTTLCGNGNLLLSLGPTRQGELAPEQLARFCELAPWITSNREAVYGTQGGPFRQDTWGGSTYIGKNLFIHLREKTNMLKFNTLKGYKVLSAKDLVTGNEIGFETKGDEVTLHIPDFEDGREIPVIALKLDKKIKFTGWLPLIK
jgi:alpha-L-fucosidase